MNKGPARDYFNSLIDLAEHEVIARSFALEIAPSTGLRNILVHEYEKVDDSIVYHSIGKVLSCYRQYLKELSAYLDCGRLLMSIHFMRRCSSSRCRLHNLRGLQLGKG